MQQNLQIFQKGKRSTPYAAKGKATTSAVNNVDKVIGMNRKHKAHSTIAEFDLVQCLEAKIPHRTAIRVIFQFQSYSWISVGDF